MPNIILDDMPTEFRGHAVKTDFRQGLKYYRIISNSEFSEEDQLEMVLLCLFENPAFTREDLAELWPFIEYYLSGGEQDREEEETGKKVFDYNADAGRIHAAFRHVYGIDLLTEKMHWWAFLSLLGNISGDTMLSKVMEIRGKDIPAKADAKYKRQLTKLKKRYEINKGSPEEEQKAEAKRVENFFKGWI